MNILSGATLDLSGSPTAQALNFGAKQFLIAGTGVGGGGVIVNHGVSQFNALQHVTLLADSTIAGAQRFDIRSVPTSGLNASAELDFSVSQTLAALTIGDCGVVILGSASGAAAARERGVATAAVPEPGSLNLLMLGVLGILGRRRSRRG